MDSLVEAICGQVIKKLDEKKVTLLLLPFTLNGKESIAYLPTNATLDVAKAQIAEEWLAKNQTPYRCRLLPEELKQIQLNSGHVFSERDQLCSVLENIDPFDKQHFAKITCKKRVLTLWGLADRQVLLNNQQACALVAEARSGPGSTAIIKVRISTLIGDLNGDWTRSNNESFSLFPMDRAFDYSVSAVLVLNTENTEMKIFGLAEQSPLLYALAGDERYRVFPLFKVTKRPLWEEFFEHVEKYEESDHGAQLVHYVKIKDRPLLDWLKAKLALSVFYSSDTPLVRCNLLVRQIANMKTYGNKTTGVNQLIEWLEEQYQELLKPIKNMIAEGNISYDALWYLFPNGSRIAVPCEESWVLLTASTTQYVENFGSGTFNFYGKVLCSNGSRYYLQDKDFVIPSFAGVVSIASLPIRTPESVPNVEQQCMQQFVKFDRYALGHHQAYCDGMVSKIGQRVLGSAETTPMSVEPSFYHKARVMVDLEQYARSGHCSKLLQIVQLPEAIRALNDEMRMSVWPFLPAFSLSSKAWVRVHCSSLSEIEYQVDAFSKVVMQPARKALLQSVIEKYGDRKRCDIVDGKNLGCSLLLCGPPGTGKTLTCEAAAEKLERPLYSVSVGELGIKPTSVEANLRQVFQVAARWNAVLLIDEADIFMEQRTHTEIKRNALVAVFLKMLEYYEGILFLTTNRVGNFDEAILSRMMLVLEYSPLSLSERREIWINQLSACGADPAQFEPRLSGISLLELNGRDINRLIGLANILASAAQQELGLQHLEQAIEATNRTELPKIGRKSDQDGNSSRRVKLE